MILFLKLLHAIRFLLASFTWAFLLGLADMLDTGERSTKEDQSVGKQDEGEE